MMIHSNDDDEESNSRRSEPDPQGQAAMLLVESLVHGLMAKDLLSVSEAVEIVDVAIDVKREIAGDLGDSPSTLEQSLNMLEAVRSSLARDIP